MVTRKPLVLVSGLSSELPTGDLVPGVDTTAQASGNAALVVATEALASGNLGIADAGIALASGNAALVLGSTALASGNAALEYIAANPGLSEGEVIGLIFALS